MKLGPLPPVGDLSMKEVLDAIRRDKKVVNGTLHYVLCNGIGSWTKRHRRHGRGACKGVEEDRARKM